MRLNETYDNYIIFNKLKNYIITNKTSTSITQNTINIKTSIKKDSKKKYKRK